MTRPETRPLGSATFGGYEGTGQPKLRATLSATYTANSWSFTAQGRFFGPMVITNGLEGQAGIAPLALVGGTLNSGTPSPNQIDDNNIPGVAYLDLRGSYRWGSNIVLYSAIDNVTDVPPPFIPMPPRVTTISAARFESVFVSFTNLGSGRNVARLTLVTRWWSALGITVDNP